MATAAAAALTAPSSCCCFPTPRRIQHFSLIKNPNFSISKSIFSSINSNNFSLIKKPNYLICNNNSLSTVSSDTTKYEFSDGASEVELRLEHEGESSVSSKDVFVDADENSLLVRVNYAGSLKTAVHIDRLYDRINPAETIWLLDEDQLVIILKKRDTELKWPDIKESWKSLNEGVLQLLKGASIYVVGDSSEINQKVSRELAVGLGYTQLHTQELLETLTKQTIDSLVVEEGSDAVAETKSAILESLSSHIRSVVSTLGGPYGAATRADKWRHLYSGFTVWLSKSEATDEKSAQEEAIRNVQTRSQAYSNADVVVKLGGWDPDYSKDVAHASLSAIKRLVLADKKLPVIHIDVDVIILTAQKWFTDLEIYGGRYSVNPDSVYQVLSARFYPMGNYLNAGSRQYPSFAWNGIRKSEDLDRKHFCCMLRNGYIIDISDEHLNYVDCHRFCE